MLRPEILLQPHRQGQKAPTEEDPTEEEQLGGYQPVTAGPTKSSAEVLLSAEAYAERAAKRHIEKAVAEERQAEAAFWELLPGLRTPPNTAFVPWLHTKMFTAEASLRCPVQAAGRLWFRALWERQQVERAIILGAGQAHPWRGRLARIDRLHRRLQWADLAWEKHVALQGDHARQQAQTVRRQGDHQQGHTTRCREGQSYRGGQLSPQGGREMAAEAAIDGLAAWVAAAVGGAHLRPLMARTSPKAGPEQLRRELLLEIWGVVLALKADALPVPAFCGLPAAAARSVRNLHTDSGDHFERLKPETQHHLLSLNAPMPDPQAILLGKEQAALLWERVRSLSPQQRRALELAAAGVPRREMAAAMGCGEESVKEHLGRARRRLRAELQRPG